MSDRYAFSENGEENVPHRVLLAEYDRILNEVKQEMRQQGREDEFIGSKVLNIQVENDDLALLNILPFRSSIVQFVLSHQKRCNGTWTIVSP